MAPRRFFGSATAHAVQPRAERGELLTVQETAARLKLSPDGVRRAIRDHGLPILRLSARRIRIDACELEDWISRNRQRDPHGLTVVPRGQR